MLYQLKSITPKTAWFIPQQRILSAKRLCSFLYFRFKRKVGLDHSFSPPGKSTVPIDIFMPTVEKDADILALAIDGAKKNILHPIENIYIVAPKNSYTLKAIAKKKRCKFVAEESILPIRKEDIHYVFKDENRNGWIFKMLLNLSADTVCTQKNILILDSDTIFIAPQIFIESGKPLFNLSDEYHFPYFEINRRLLGMQHVISRSYITHYMIFNAKVLQKLRKTLKEKYNKPWYRVIIDGLNKKQRSAFADYEIYGDFYRQYLHLPCILNYWSNISLGINQLDNLNGLIEKYQSKYRSISLHNYNRN